MTPADFIATLAVLAILVLLIKGGIQTFQRNWILALILLVFLTPLWACWAIVEVFLPKPKKEPMVVQMQPVEVNVKNT